LGSRHSGLELVEGLLLPQGFGLAEGHWSMVDFDRSSCSQAQLSLPRLQPSNDLQVVERRGYTLFLNIHYG
jgi:hypothetical protein